MPNCTCNYYDEKCDQNHHSMRFTFLHLCWCFKISIHFKLIYWNITWDNEHRWISYISVFGMLMKISTSGKNDSHERGTQGQGVTSTGPNTMSQLHLTGGRPVTCRDRVAQFISSKWKLYLTCSQPHWVSSLSELIRYLNSVFGIEYWRTFGRSGFFNCEICATVRFWECLEMSCYELKT